MTALEAYPLDYAKDWLREKCETGMYSQQNKYEGCSKRSANEAAGSMATEAYPQGYVEDAVEARTKLKVVFSRRVQSSRRICD